MMVVWPGALQFFSCTLNIYVGVFCIHAGSRDVLWKFVCVKILKRMETILTQYVIDCVSENLLNAEAYYGVELKESNRAIFRYIIYSNIKRLLAKRRTLKVPKQLQHIIALS